MARYPKGYGIGQGVSLLIAVLFGTVCIYSISANAITFGPEGRPAQPIMEMGRPAVGFVVVGGAPIHDGPGRSSEVVERCEYLQKFELADVVMDRVGQSYTLLATVDRTSRAITEFHGWIASGHLLTSHEALKSPETFIYRKALIINEWRKMEDDLTRLEAAPIFDGPGKREDGTPYNMLTKRGLFTFYYIFAELGRAGEKYYLLGERPLITSDQHPEKTILGWIAGERVHIWDTRDAIQYNKSNLSHRINGLPVEDAGVKIFESPAALKAALRRVPTVDPLAEEDITVTSPWPYYVQRYPILEAVSAAEYDVPLAGRFLRIGYIGDQIYTETGEKGHTAPELDIARKKVEEIKKGLSNIDLLFVMDATGSMQRYFAPSAGAVNNILSTIKDEYGTGAERPRLRISVTFYRDYTDADGTEGSTNPTDTYLWKREPLTEDLARITRFLESERIPAGAGGDEPEAVFFGIQQAIQQADKEMADASYRLLILIGDKGNHVPDPQNITVQKIVRQLRDEHYDFIGMHVVPEEAVLVDTDVRRFRDQVNEIVRALPEGDGEYLIDPDPQSVANRIMIGGGRAVESAEQLKKAATETVGSGKPLPELQMKYGTRLTKRLAELMRSKGVDPVMFSKKSIQIFERGWVAEVDIHSGQPQIQPVILVGRADIEMLVAIIGGFLKERPTKQDIMRTWTSVLQIHLGEDIDFQKPVSEQIQNRLGLPIHNKLLQKTVFEIANLPADGLVELFRQLKEDLTNMRAVMAEEKIRIEWVAPGEASAEEYDIRVVPLGRQWYWFLAKGQDMAWISYEKLP